MAAYKLRDINGKVVAEHGAPFVYDETASGWRMGVIVVPDSGRALSVWTSRITSLTFIERWGSAAKKLYELEATNLDVRLAMEKFRSAAKESDGTSIDLADPRTISGVTALAALLESVGTFPAGTASTRAADVLALPA